MRNEKSSAKDFIFFEQQFIYTQNLPKPFIELNRTGSKEFSKDKY